MTHAAWHRRPVNCLFSVSKWASLVCAALQRYTIRDLNTGQLYVLDGDEGPASPYDPASPASSRVTDVIQGRQLSLDEFEQLLGLNAVLEVCFATEFDIFCNLKSQLM